ncbi:hypothetical protein ABAZ39_19320 (plasmid) [Azospirillum argentinense]|uniref:Uncharacterized protein n=1 Tax=Azospirillum argentinense TaxID=2970906 RepID=A0A060DSD1_9PROT|nr:hypothetical protein [Azospirillum argentinense]AIB14078.1 hypothetical protein ABAZ39_19320 [Azospirillum argentinense]EZQ06481.1 hypothetical protein ABAZ39_18780 [Azospirillum argentinense]
MKIIGYPDDLIPRVASASLGTYRTRQECADLLAGMADAEKAFGSITWHKVMLLALTKPEPLDEDTIHVYESEVDNAIARVFRKMKMLNTLAAAASKDLGALAKANPKDAVAKKALAATKAVPGVTAKLVKVLEDAIDKDRKDIKARLAKDEATHEKQRKAAAKAAQQTNGGQFVNPFEGKDIDDILKSSKLTLLLHAYAKTEKTDENVEFLSITRKGVDQRAALKLYNLFIDPNGAKSLNITGQQRTDFSNGIGNGAYVGVLKDIQTHIRIVVSGNTLTRAQALDEPALRKLGYK